MAKCQIFSFTQDLNEVIRDGLYMQAVVGETMSIGVVHFVSQNGPGIKSQAHAHGEEVTLQIRGGCTVYLGSDVQGFSDPSVELESGRVMTMPADQSHYGVNRFNPDGQCLRLNVVTPPRKEYGSKGATKVYYPGAETTR